mgnify:CR=1 FL=1
MMRKKLISLSIIFLFLLVAFSNVGLVFSKEMQTQEKSSLLFSYLCEDTIVYFEVPEQAEMSILYDHIWAFDDATFSIYDEVGQLYDSIVFSYDEDLLVKTVFFEDAGTYKMVATGVNFRYQIQLSAPSGQLKCVAAAMPHKAVFRLRDGEQVSGYIPVSSNHVEIHMSADYHVPARDATVRIFDEYDELLESVYLDSTDMAQCYEQIRSFSRDVSDSALWRFEIVGHDGGHSKVVVWTNKSVFPHPTGKCNLIAPEPQYFFVPEFLSRSASVSFDETNNSAVVGSSGYVVGEQQYVEIYNAFVEQLDLKTSKHWVSWYWRENQNSNTMNDDADPFHINWAGFNMGPFDERMQFFTSHQIKPILCLQWDSSAFISDNPALWTQNEMDEFAEFCLAVAIHSVAPDLEDPPLDREPYDIFGIMPLNEPNLIYYELLNMSEGADAYIRLLETIGQRFRNYPDSRISEMKFVVPGITPHFYGSDGFEYWISEMLLEAKDYVDMVFWDQYQYYLLEDLPSYSQDIIHIKEIMDEVGVHRPMGLSEFGIHGGIPTIEEFYGSSFAKLYTFGALANCINNGMRYPIYFTLIDPNNEPRQKGLLSGLTSYPPYSYLPPLSAKPQYYAMQVVGWICRGDILELDCNLSQVEVLSSKQDEVLRFGLSNRYESSTSFLIPVDEGASVFVYNVTDSGLILEQQYVSTGSIEVVVPRWSLYYVETNTGSSGPKSDLYCGGSLLFSDVKPGSVVNGSFSIENRGDEGTVLNWEISSVPQWGEWSFSSGESGQLRENETYLLVNVSLVVPDEKNKDFDDMLVISNTDDPTDVGTVSVVLSTPRSTFFKIVEFLQSIIPENLKFLFDFLFF